MRITESRIRRIIREEAQRILNEGTDEDKVRRSLSVIQGILSDYGRYEQIPNIDDELAAAMNSASADKVDLIYERFNELRKITLELVKKLKTAQAVLLAGEPGDISESYTHPGDHQLRRRRSRRHAHPQRGR